MAGQVVRDKVEVNYETAATALRVTKEPRMRRLLLDVHRGVADAADNSLAVLVQGTGWVGGAGLVFAVSLPDTGKSGLAIKLCTTGGANGFDRS